MYNSLKIKLSTILTSDHERTAKIKKNIVFSFLIKGLTILLSLILVPLTINYITGTQYGIWLTLSSIIGWFSLFDIGIANGLRNKVAELNAHSRYKDSRVYISTAYMLFFFIAVILFFVFYIGASFINWQKILNTTELTNFDLNRLSLIVFFIFCCQLVFQTINVILTACHEIYKTAYINLLGALLSLFIIYMLKASGHISLFYLTLALGGAPLMVQAIASLYFFAGTYKHLAPSVKLVKLGYAKSLLNLGSVFFLLQISALILLQTDNIIITHVLGPKYVTDFTIAYKLFAIFTSVFTIVISPYWTAFTEAYTKKDFEWIDVSMKKMHRVWAILSSLVLLVLLGSKWIFAIWVGELAQIPFSLSLALAVSVICCMWQMINVYFLNGIGKVRLQLITGGIMTLINIPLAVFLGERIGLAGIVTANTIVYLVTGVFCFRQRQSIIKSNLSNFPIPDFEKAQLS